VAIDFIKRFVADLDLNSETRYVPEIKEKKEDRVAIIGAGPAGLTCAYYLAIEGYQVTIYEKLPVEGGMLSVGIPEYRLPRDVIHAEIQIIKDMGVEIKKGVEIGKDITIDQLRQQGNKAIFVGIGAHECKKLGVEGEDLDGVYPGIDFLRDVNLGEKIELGSRIAVVGGGNVAMDSVRTAKRLGAKEAFVIYRRSFDEMPANEEEIEECKEEGIEIRTLTTPTRIIGEKGRVKAIECIEMTLGEPDESGRRRPVPKEGSEFVLDVDGVIPAIGQESDWDCLGPECACTLSDWGTMNADPLTLQTDDPDVFAGGDAVTGPRTVIEAIAAGKEAAISIDRYIQGMDLSEGRGREWEVVKDVETEGHDHTPRMQMPRLAPERRLDNFSEVQLGFTEEQAVAEAERCLECGICSECYQCVEVCEAKAIDHSMLPEEREIEVGTIIVATGYDLMDPSPLREFGYGRYPNVFTSLEFERLNNATGPTEGKILMRDENGELTKSPESVAIVHCVGSRDENYHEYCSRVCCMYALKYGHLIKDKVGHHTKIYDFYVDMRCFGKGYEEFYRRCQEEGIIFFRGKPAEITDKAITQQEEGKLIIIGEDTLMNRPIRIPVDMVILCAAIEARKDTPEMSKILGIEQGADGFFKEGHPKLAPLNTAVAGIFLAGACQGPKDIPDTVGQASGAAARALDLAIRGKVEIPATVAWIDADVCEGCLTCIKQCTHSAIEFDAGKGVAVVHPFRCEGCGTCVVNCPSGAAHMWQFSENQILTEGDGIMEPLQAVGM
jgi:heterodisulfide reductase subunit A